MTWLGWLTGGSLKLAMCVVLLLLVSGCGQKWGWSPPPPAPPAPPPPPPKVEYQVYYVAADRLNLRACPGMDCPKIGMLGRNQEVEKVGESQGWFQVRARSDGTLGWVDARYLSSAPVPETATLPATEASPPRQVKPVEAKPETKPETKVEVKPRPKPKPAAAEEEEVEEKPTPRRRRVPEAEAAEPPETKPAPAPEQPSAPPPAPAPPSEPPKKKIRIM